MDAPKHTFEMIANKEDICQMGEDEGRMKNTIAVMAPVKAKDSRSRFLWRAVCMIPFLSSMHVASGCT